MRHRTSLALAIALTAVLTACGVDAGVTATRAEPTSDASSPTTGPEETTPDDTSPPTTDTAGGSTTTLPPPVTAPPSTIDQTPGGEIDIADVVDVGDDKTPRDYDAFVAAAITDLQAWWGERYPAVYGRDFTPLAGGVIAAYPTRSGQLPGCGEPETTYQQVNEYAAFYCPIGDFMIYDDGDDSLLATLADEFGPSIMGVVLSHEYGHAIQQRNGDLERQLATIVTEQQADCFSGAWFAHAVRGESDTIRLTDADVRSGLIAMVTVRDPVGVDQLSDGGHGSAFDRIGAFQEGYTGGVERCAELIDDPLPLLPNTFQTTSDELNEGDLGFGFDEGTIGPLIVDALTSYWTFALGELGLTMPALTLDPVDDLGAVASTCDDATRPLDVGVLVCPSSGVVAVDDEFARRLYDDPIDGRSDFAVGYLIATGWAERVQEVLDSDLTGEARALANDCLVGASTRDMLPRDLRPGESENRGVISPGDLDEAVIAAITIGDPGFADDRIGSGFEKIDAFRDGVLGGLDPCLERIGR